MSYLRKFGYLNFAGVMLLTLVPSAGAQVLETTTVTTSAPTAPVVISSPGSVIAPGTVVTTTSNVRSYAVIDPITGEIKDYYDPIVKRTVSGVTLRSGLVVADKLSGNLIGTVDALGNVVSMSSIPATESFVVSIDTRRRDLELALDSALSKGQITAAQAAGMRADLEKIAAEEAAARAVSNSLSAEQAFMLANRLDLFQARMVPLVKTVVVQQPIISPRFMVVEGRTVYTDAITFRKAQLRQRIDDEYAAGRLSSQQVADLKSKINTLASEETRYRKDGELSSSENRKINIKLDRTQTSLDKDVAIINQKRSRIGIRVD